MWPLVTSFLLVCGTSCYLSLPSSYSFRMLWLPYRPQLNVCAPWTNLKGASQLCAVYHIPLCPFNNITITPQCVPLIIIISKRPCSPSSSSSYTLCPPQRHSHTPLCFLIIIITASCVLLSSYHTSLSLFIIIITPPMSHYYHKPPMPILSSRSPVSHSLSRIPSLCSISLSNPLCRIYCM